MGLELDEADRLGVASEELISGGEDKVGGEGRPSCWRKWPGPLQQRPQWGRLGKIILEANLATAVPEPMGIPVLAFLRAGACLMRCFWPSGSRSTRWTPSVACRMVRGSYFRWSSAQWQGGRGGGPWKDRVLSLGLSIF